MRECEMCHYVGPMKEIDKGILECPECKETYIKEWTVEIKKPSKDTKINIDELIKLCANYDKKFGTYPEHCYEGQAVLVYILNKLVETKEAEL